MLPSLCAFAALLAAAAPGRAAEVVVLGSLHLRQSPAGGVPVAVPAIRQRVVAWRPDQVVIEWLHPSIPAESTFNYPRLGDRRTLGMLWGMPAAPSDGLLDSLRSALRTVTGPPSVRIALRIELGKALYLRGDQANAAYQWYRAGRAGGEIGQLARLAEHLLGGHEAVEFGFAAAATAGLEEVTPFDYQGPEAGSEVWGEMLEAMADTAAARIDRARPGTPAWTAARARFDSLRSRFDATRDTVWAARYGALPFVAQYRAAFEGFGRFERAQPAERDGLTVMRWLQTAAADSIQREAQVGAIGGITFGGFGARRVAGIMARNRRMADFLDRDAKRLGSARILVVVGSGHKFALQEILAERGYVVRSSEGLVP